jgi:hypothetical protein
MHTDGATLSTPRTQHLHGMGTHDATVRLLKLRYSMQLRHYYYMYMCIVTYTYDGGRTQRTRPARTVCGAVYNTAQLLGLCGLFNQHGPTSARPRQWGPTSPRTRGQLVARQVCRLYNVY